MGKNELVGILKLSDIGRISSLTVNGDRTHTKHLELIFGKKDPSKALYVSDCKSHDEPPGTSPQIGVKVRIRIWHPDGDMEEVGYARCCPLCWRILSADYPMVKPKPIVIQSWAESRRKQLSAGRKTQKRQRAGLQEKRIRGHLDDLLELATAKRKAGFDMAEAQAVTEMSRSRTRELVDRLIKAQKVEKVSGGRGRGNKLIFRKKAP